MDCTNARKWLTRCRYCTEVHIDQLEMHSTKVPHFRDSTDGCVLGSYDLPATRVVLLTFWKDVNMSCHMAIGAFQSHLL